MLKELRIKFIAMNMLMVTVVVVAVLGIIGFANYQQSMNGAFSSLEEAALSAARTSENSAAENAAAENAASENAAANRERLKGEKKIDGRGKTGGVPLLDMPQLGGKNRRFIPIATYEVVDGSYELVSQATTAFLDETTLSQAIAEVETAHSKRGTLDGPHLLYAQRVVDGRMYVAFTDESNVSDWKNLIAPLVGIGVLTLLVFFVISFFFSKWALRPVEEAWEKQRQFVANASHELKTPITVILANMSILGNHPLDSVTSQSQWIESTQREAQGMQELVLDLLDMASIENAHTQESFEACDLSEMVESRLLQVESVMFESDLLMDYEVDEGVRVEGSRSQLERLLVILLDNARKYALPSSTVFVSLKKGLAQKPDGAAPSTVCGSIPKGECAILSVHNDGEAIDPEDLPHIFERFYRSDKARGRAEGNYGLGLAIAAETVEAHKGCTLVRSAAESGTTFTVAIPLA